MPKKRTSDHIYTQKHVHQTKQGKIFAVSLILKKAFDSVLHNGLFLKLLQSGVGGKTYDIKKDIYNGNTCCVKINNKRTDYFTQSKGVRQGCNLSTTLFNIYMKELASALEKFCIHGLSLEGREIRCLLYADDLLLLSSHKEGLHHSLSILEEFSTSWALSINMQKSKIMIFSKKKLADKKRYTFKIRGTTLDHFTSYSYLGVTISASEHFSQALKDLTAKACRAFLVLKKHFLNLTRPLNCG